MLPRGFSAYFEPPKAYDFCNFDFFGQRGKDRALKKENEAFKVLVFLVPGTLGEMSAKNLSRHF